jgi:hypothetical protein
MGAGDTAHDPEDEFLFHGGIVGKLDAGRLRNG